MDKDWDVDRLTCWETAPDPVSAPRWKSHQICHHPLGKEAAGKELSPGEVVQPPERTDFPLERKKKKAQNLKFFIVTINYEKFEQLKLFKYGFCQCFLCVISETDYGLNLDREENVL